MSAFEFEGHEALVAQLRAGTLDAPDHLQRRVLALREKRARVPMSPRRKVFTAVAVAVTLALGAAVVQGAFFAGSNSTAKNQARVVHGTAAFGPLVPASPTGPQGVHYAIGAKGATGARGATGAAGPTGAKGPTGAVGAAGPVLQADQAGTAYKAALPEHALSSLSRGSVSIPTGRLVHADATLQVVVPNHDALTQATNDARQIVTRLGGYAQSVQYQFSRSGYGRAYLSLHVPLGKTQTAIDQLGALGQLAYQQISTQDLERQYTQQTSAIGRLRRQIAVYVQALQSGTLSGAQRLDVQLRLANARHELKATQKARVHTVSSGHTANIQLNLSTKQHGHAAVGPHRTGRIGRMLHNVGAFLALEGIIILYALIAALPIILLAALIWWLIRERRRREEKLLAANA